jgi:DNA-binding transcriptional MerR regulator
MLISEAAKAAGVNKSTVQFYVRIGLVKPTTGGLGRSVKYQFFSREDVDLIRMTRVAQTFGMSLQEVCKLRGQFGSDGFSFEKRIEITRQQLKVLEQREVELKALITYLRKTLSELEAPGANLKKWPEPEGPDFLPKLLASSSQHSET